MTHAFKEHIDALPEEEQKIIINDKLWKEYFSKHKDKDYTQQEKIRSSYKRIKDQLSKLHTPEDKLHIQLENLFSLDRSVQDIYQESKSIYQNIVISKQKDGNFSTTTHQELIDSANAIKTGIDQICKIIQTSIDTIRPKVVEELINKFEQQIPKNYTPYYSVDDGAEDKKIASILPNASGILAIRRALSRLGIDIQENATETKVAELANYFEKNRTFAPEMQKAFKYFNVDYSYIRAILTIDDIEKVTNGGHVVLTHVYKEGKGIEGCFVTIEKVSRTENGDPICTIYDPYDPKNQKIRQIPYRELQLVLSDHHLLPTNWQELADTHEA